MENSWIYRFCPRLVGPLEMSWNKEISGKVQAENGRETWFITSIYNSCRHFLEVLSLEEYFLILCWNIDKWQERMQTCLHTPVIFTPSCLYSILSHICLTFTLLLIIIVIIIPLSHLHFTAFFPPKSFLLKVHFLMLFTCFISITQTLHQTPKQRKSRWYTS